MTAPIVPRRARLKPEYFQSFGYTVGCPGCDQFQIGGSIRRNQNEGSRDRIETELSTTDLGKDRLGRAKDRLDHKLAEMTEELADGPGHPKDVSNEEQQTQGQMMRHCWRRPRLEAQTQSFPYVERGKYTSGPQTDVERRKGEETLTTWMKTSTRSASSIRRLRRGKKKQCRSQDRRQMNQTPN